MSVPEIRIRQCNQRPVRPGGDLVLYWMIAARRTHDNFALDRAIERARELGKPLVVLEALRCEHRWASDRNHAFVLDGMADNAARFADTPVRYHAYVEPERGAGKGLVEALADRACAVITDDYPGFFLPRMIAAASRVVPVLMEAVDSNGLYPIAATDRVFTTAASFRRHLHKEIAPHLGTFPRRDPLRQLRLPALRSMPRAITGRWPAARGALLGASHAGLGDLPIDHRVAATELRGGSSAARARLRRFIDRGLPRYLDARNQPGQDVASGLSPYLHFGHISAHHVFTRVMKRDDWSPADLAEKPTGKRHGWWGASETVEAFVDELITWREIGYNMAAKVAGYDRYESLPPWSRATLEEHWHDPRDHQYSIDDFEHARTHDALWNAAQRQLVGEGRIHNYLRMLWGKKILEWTPDPRRALAVLIELNNKYALDGRDPNSYSGIFWCLGRYDRAWGPERSVYGKVRYMSSANTARKVDVKGYIARWSHPG